jgi:hypothetical protein
MRFGILYWLLIITIPFQLTCGQVLVKGNVQSQNQQALSAVSVLAYQITASDTVLIKYAITDAKGFFKINLSKSEKTHLIKASALGFADGLLWVSPTDTLLIHTFTLAPKELQLREVVVKSQIPIQVKKDTIVYSAKAFTDGTEKTVEDLLRKLPGVKVSEDGKITVKGKPIDKVMLEGEDFFSKNYRFITRNLTADVLDKIEAIDNYTENALLHGIEKSGKVVLNLTIKVERKLKVFGNANISVGIRERYSLNEALFSLVRKVKLGIIGNANNIGYDPIMNAENELNADDNAFSGFSSAGNGANPLLFLKMANIPDIDPKRVTFNQAKLAGTNLNYKVNEKLKMKGFGYYYDDKLAAGNRTVQQFLLDNTTLKIQDSSWNFRKPHLWAGQLRTDYLLNKKTSIRWITDVKNTVTQNDYFLDSKNLELSEKVSVIGKENVRMTHHQLNIVTRLSAKNALLADIGFSSNQLPQQTQANSGRYFPFFGLVASYNQLFQNVNNNNEEWKAIVRWKGVKNKNNFTLASGFLRRAEQLNSDISLKNENGLNFNADTTFSNDATLQKDIFLFEGHYQVQYGILQLMGSSSIQATKSTFRDPTHNLSLNQSQLFLNPSIAIGADLGNNQRLLALFSRNQVLPSINDLAVGYVLNQYRSFSRSRAIFNTNKNDMWLLSYSNMNWQHYYSINGSISFNRTLSSSISNYQLSNTLSFTTNQPIFTPLDRFSANWQVDKLLTQISVKVRLEGSWSHSNMLNRINTTDLHQSTLRNLNSRIYLISAFEGFFNITLSSNWNISRIFTQNNNAAISQTSLFRPNLIISLRPIKEFHFKITGEHITWKQNNNRSSTHFLDVELRFYPPKSKWSFEVIGNNLLDAKQLFYTQISNFFISQNSYFLQPRFVTFSVSRMF